ncbi:MAG: hypothetical protein ACKVZ0_00575 [Gemmatimonadales bacterium]
MGGLLLLLQAAQITVTATVDRDRAPVGDQINYTLRAVTALAGPVRIELPQQSGLEIVERTERIDPVAGPPATRAYQLELVLRAAEVGRWRFGPVLVFVGASTEVAPDVEVTVTATSNVDANRNPRVVELIQRVPPPDPGANATLAIVLSDPRLYQGDQLDILTAAWFPRSLRARLRRPPTLKPPVLAGVWAVPQPALPGIVASRAIGEEVYDLFVSHQVAYPLTPGTLTIPPARLEYAVPMSRRASGDERAVEAASRPVTVEVLTPAGAAPVGFRGPQGRRIQVGYRIRSLPAHAGEALPVDITVAGEGNLAFWPPPNVTWPAGTRAYLDRVTETGRPQGGRLGGVKTFHFLLLPDSVGSLALAPIDYDFFDTESGQYRAANGIGLVVPVLASRSTGPRREPPPLVAARDDWAWWSGRVGPGGAWWWVLGLAPVLGLAVVSGVRRWRRRAVAPVRQAPNGIGALEAIVSRLVADPDRGHLGRLAAGLRRAGINGPTAHELAGLKRRIDEGRFARAGVVDDDALGRDAGAVIARLPRRILQRVGLGVVLLLGPIALASQPEPTAEAWYRDGAAGPAAAGFLDRAALEPGRWQHWYNAGAAWYLAGRDADAAAALDRALALAPRAAAPRTLWMTLERQYEPLRAARRRPWSEGEQALVAMVLWWLGVGLAVGPRTRRVGWAVAVVAMVIGVSPRRWWTWTPEGFTTREVRLLRSPHGLAPDQGGLGALTPVTVGARRAGWLLIIDRPGNRGWIPAAAVASGAER